MLALKQARRARTGPVSVRYSPLEGVDHLEVAYTVPRAVGTAVRRNRLRRRLRAVMRDVAADLPGGAYMVVCGPEAAALEFGELHRAVHGAARRAAGR